MTEHPFQEPRRGVRSARLELEGQMKSARQEFDRAAEHFRSQVAEERGRFAATIAEARQRFEAAWSKAQQGRSGQARRNRDPGASSEPVPVRPTNPSSLSGGAEAPLDP